ncbi:Cut9-interacting protein scn1 [Recurvomyces mirabilis]|nr:Cut9-interacting protein scn1 [Recurvomyces mirabilis]
MATRAQDQELVAKAADKYGFTTRDLERLGEMDWSQDHKIVPAFGWHPWFSYQMYDEADFDGALSVSREQKVEHYFKVLTPYPGTDDRKFLLSLPEPLPFNNFLARTKEHLSRYPLALIGEIGLDKSFRIPEDGTTEHDQQRDVNLTPGGREGRQLSRFRVSMNQQRKVLLAQLRLAGELRRAASVHGVAAHGVLYETLAETWKGHEKHTPSKRERRKAEAAGNTESMQQDEQELAAESSGPLPYPPRICLHSFSGQAETVKQYIAPAIPCEVFFSFSTTINSWIEDSSGQAGKSGKVEAAVRAVPDDRILIESDLHSAGPHMDQYLAEIVRKICEVKGWQIDEGVRMLGRNWKRDGSTRPTENDTPDTVPSAGDYKNMNGSYATGSGDGTARNSIDPRLLTYDSLSERQATPGQRRSSKGTSTERNQILSNNSSMTTLVDSTIHVSLPRTSLQPVSCWPIDDLFGPRTGSVPITGTRPAITQLMKDKSINNLYIQPITSRSIQEAVTISHHHLRRLTIFPSIEELRFTFDLPEDISNPFGINSDEYLRSRTHAEVDFPFISFDMSKALAALKKLATCHDQKTLMDLGIEQHSSFRVGVITSVPGGGYKVELFDSGETIQHTVTIWLYRACSMGEEGMVQEVWRPLSDGTFVAPTIDAQSVIPTVPSKTRTADATRDDVSLRVDSASPSAIETTLRQPNKRARQIATYPTDKPSDYLWTICPEEVSGNAILNLARFYSNTEIFENLNYNLSAQRKKLIVDVNVITRRITNAISTTASSNQGLTKAGIRADLNSARKDNGVIARMEAKTKVKKAYNKMAREMVGAFGETDQVMGEVEDDFSG